MQSYVIHDNEVLKELKENKIHFKRDSLCWFEVDLQLSATKKETKRLKSGRELYVDGTVLKIVGETGIDLIPGRYFDTYIIAYPEVREAFERNKYTLENIGGPVFIINAFIPKSKQCRLPDGTIIESDARGVLTLVN